MSSINDVTEVHDHKTDKSSINSHYKLENMIWKRYCEQCFWYIRVLQVSEIVTSAKKVMFFVGVG